jgi:hypothetical protein
MRQLREQHNVQINCRFWLRLVDYNIGARHDAFATSAAAAGRHDDASCSRLRSGSDTGQRCLRGANHRAPNSPSRPQVLSDIASVKAGPAGPSYDRRERTLSQLPAPVRRADMFAVLTAPSSGMTSPSTARLLLRRGRVARERQAQKFGSLGAAFETP